MKTDRNSTRPTGSGHGASPAGEVHGATGSEDPDGRALELVNEVTLCAHAAGLDLSRARAIADFARARGRPLVSVLVERAGVDEPLLLERLAKRLSMPFLDATLDTVDHEVVRAISPSLALKWHVMPIGQADGVLKVACCDPFGWEWWDELSFLLRRQLSKVLCPSGIIERMLKSHYGIGADTLDHLVNGGGDTEESVARRGDSGVLDDEAANEPTVVNLLNKILAEGIRSNATDVHFEPYEDKFRVRYRIDGILEDASVPQSVKVLRLALISRIKVMANLDIAEKRLPQDGRCHVTLAGQEYDLRVSVMPGIHGEAVVLRLQSRGMARLALESLGFEADEEDKMARLVSRPHGLLLVTGPTGSGKTTTLYACLNRIVNPGVKIVTIEDPVEYWMDDILQMQVHQEIGFTFGRALRHILRHDPDVMLVGEIRDRETADIAIRSSLTGHLVFATLHTNDAAGAPTRLIDIGVERYLVASAVHGVLAQRLVRNVCQTCKEEQPVESLSDYERSLLLDAGILGQAPLWRGRGCERCRFTGFRGRSAAGEILEVSSAIRRFIQEGNTTDQIRRQAQQEGMRALRDSALLKVKAGSTTVSEVLRITQTEI